VSEVSCLVVNIVSDWSVDVSVRVIGTEVGVSVGVVDACAVVVFPKDIT
jgi:hypothetical protein